jgi:hypothetical protein
MDDLDRSRAPRIGQDLARWIWITVISLLLLGVLGLWAWKTVQRDRSLEQRKTGILLRSRAGSARGYLGASEVPAFDASNGSTT